jgi:hypothetical protein
MRLSCLAGLSLIALALPACGSPRDGAPSAPTTSIGTIANASYHARRTFGTGLYDATANKTFVTYNGANMDLYVKAFNHASGSWEASKLVAAWGDSSQGAYHDYGTMVLMPDGKLAIFVADLGGDKTYVLKAPAAHSVAGAWTKRQIVTASGDNNGYPIPVVVGTTVHLFFSLKPAGISSSLPYRIIRLVRSTDSGATWSTAQTVIDSKGWLDGATTRGHDQPYVFGMHATGGRIYLSWVMAGGGSSGINYESKNLYLAYHDTATGKMRSAAGTDLGATVDCASSTSCPEFKTNTLVYTSSPGSGDYFRTHPIQNSAIGVTATSPATPVVAFGEERKDGTRGIRLSKFVGGAWSTTSLDTTTSRFMDMARTGTSAFELLYTDQGFRTLVSKTHTLSGTTTQPNPNLTIPHGSPGCGTPNGTTCNKSDRVFYVNFIENRQRVKAVGGAIHYNTRQSDYTADWPVFAIDQR